MSEHPIAEFAARQLRTLLQPGADHPAVLYDEDWSTWGELADLAAAMEAQLAAHEVPRRAPVALVPRNRPSGLAALLGLLAEGRVPTLVSPIQPASAIAAAVEALGPAAVILEESDLADEIRAAAARAGALCMTVSGSLQVVDDAARLRAVREQAVASEDLAGDDVALIVPTSGTTGPPKPVVVSWSQMPFDPAKGIRPPVAPEVRPPVVHVLSMATITGVMGVLRAMARGRALAMLERVDVDQWSKLVERFRLQRAGLPPAAMQTMLDVGIPPERLASLEAWQTGSAPLTPELQKDFETVYGVPVLVAYGATEFGGPVSSWTLDLHREWSDRKRGSVGRAMDGFELRVVDEATGAELPPDQVGLLSVRLPHAIGRTGDGWLRTNDRARIDRDGFLFILGRADDVIVRGGFKVPLGELEALFREHPGVRDAAAVGLPDVRLGQVPAVAVVLEAGSTVTTDQLIAWARDRTAPYKVPTSILVLDALPLGASHKTNRIELREVLAGAIDQAAEFS